MKVSVQIVSAAAMLLMAAGMPAWPDEVDPPEAAASAASAPWPRRAPPRLANVLRGAGSTTAPATARGAHVLWGVGVVELPSQSVLPGPRRPHHALTFPAESPRRLLRSIGVDATECATRVRLPTHLKQARGGVEADVQGQLLFNCRF